MVTTPIQPGANGHVNEEAVVDVLQHEATIGYMPTMPLESLWLAGSDQPQITLRRDLEFMQMHPIVQTSLDYYKSGIAGADFWGGPDHTDPSNDKGRPISMNPKVAEFVLALVERFWADAVPVLQEGAYPYGWGAGEHIYKEVDGMLVWDRMKDFHPNDAFILTTRHQPIGVRVKHIRDKEPVDLWFSSGTIPAKACWYPHRARFNQFYGRSQLIGAWRPWRRLGWRDAVEQVIDAAIYRAGYSGPTVAHPPGFSGATAKPGIPATTQDSQGNPRREYRDIARQMIEWAKAGAGFTHSSEVYSGTSIPKWSIKWPEHVMDVRPLIEAARYLEDQIMLGIGVPPELVRSGGTGSGYSGRSIPREAFLDGQQRIANAILHIFVEHVVRPLVLWNFGDVPFHIRCKSLLHSQAEAKRSEGDQAQQPDNLKRSDAAKDAWAKRQGRSPGQPPLSAQQQGQPEQAQATPQPAFSMPMYSSTLIDPVQRDKVLEVVERVMRRRAA